MLFIFMIQDRITQKETRLEFDSNMYSLAKYEGTFYILLT